MKQHEDFLFPSRKLKITSSEGEKKWGVMSFFLKQSLVIIVTLVTIVASY